MSRMRENYGKLPFINSNSTIVIVAVTLILPPPSSPPLLPPVSHLRYLLGVVVVFLVLKYWVHGSQEMSYVVQRLAVDHSRYVHIMTSPWFPTCIQWNLRIVDTIGTHPFVLRSPLSEVILYKESTFGVLGYLRVYTY